IAQTNSWLMLLSCLMFGCLSGQETQTGLPKARISCPEGTNAYGSYCYYFNEDRETWVDAELYCQNMHSGDLVSVLSQAQGAFVASLIRESGTDDFNVWIGLHDPKKNCCWHQSSGSLVSYRSWDIRAPSSVSPGYCASLTSSSEFKKWKDMPCVAKFSFVCKFKN
uniref:Rerating family member 1 alpha n=1 Tax=Prolemur simus TaxID=1328070 RepID=A0A8C9AC84_PROSS